MKQLLQKLTQPIDNAPLIIFRIFLGILIAAESFGAIMTGWVYNVLVKPEIAFTHIGFEWLSPLMGTTMYYYFGLMGVMGILIALGYKYRFAIISFTILWAGAFLIQKYAYNNHYYLLLLIAFLMIFMPANTYASIDAKQNPYIKTNWMPFACSAVFIFQMFLVYTFATIAKFYGDWLDGTFTGNLFKYNQYAHLIPVFEQKWFHLFLAYAGILFDGLIIPALLYKRTRTIAFCAAIFFHIFNAVTLQIGIFPFFALSFTVFFYPPEKIGSLFFKKRVIAEFPTQPYSFNPLIKYLFSTYFIIQIALPLRHWFFKGDVLWTEEGHRLSWRMMLRQRHGDLQYKVINKANNQEIAYDYTQKLTGKQLYFVKSHPDGIWQMAQHIKKEFQEKGVDVAVYAKSFMLINQQIQYPYIYQDVDLANEEWHHLKHHNWIILYDKKGNELPRITN